MKSIFKAVALITFFTVITRLLGFFFRVFLSREIGAEALGIYQVSLSVFTVLITLVASGLPLIISKISARLQSSGDTKKESSMVTTALIISLIISTLACLIVLIFNKALGAIFTDERCIVLLILLLPAVICSSVYSTFRGALWGHSNYFGLCISELFEQVARIVICVIMLGGAITLMDGAMTAATSLTIACFCSCIFVVILYFAYGGRLARPKGFVKELIKTSTPITSVRLASSLIQPLIAIIIPLRLVAAGMSGSDAMALYGIAIGMTLPFLFIPSALIGSLGIALVPDLSAAVTQQNTNHVKSRSTSSIIITLFISCFFVPLYMGAGENIGLFFYDNITSGRLLAYSAWLMVPIGLTNITSSILNALGCEMKSMKNYIFGSILMLIAMWVLPQFIGINTIIVAMGLCLTLSSFLNLRMINKVSGGKIIIRHQLIKIILISIPVASLVSFSTNLLNHFLPLFFNLAISCSIGAFFFLALCHIFNIMDIKIWILNILKKKKTSKRLSKQKVRI